MKSNRLIPPIHPAQEPKFFSPQVARARRFYLNLQPPQGVRLAVVCGGLEHCRSDYTIHRRTFPYYSIEYVVHGSGYLKLQDQTFDLNSGAVFSYGPGVPHDITNDPDAPLVKYFVDFWGKQATSLLHSCKLQPGRVARVFPPNILSSLFDELVQSGLQQGRRNGELCVKLLECLALKITGANAPLKGIETLAYATYQHCRQRIEKDFIKLRNLDQIAAECHADKAYLCRLFRRYDQQSPYQLLLRFKMNHAAERLQQQGILVKQVAQETGFTDQFHFSRVFKNILGLAPNSFRSLQQEQSM